MTDPNDMNGNDLPTIDSAAGVPANSGSDLPTNEDMGGLSSAPRINDSILDETGGTGAAGLSRGPDDAAGAPVHQVSGKKTDEVP